MTQSPLRSLAQFLLVAIGLVAVGAATYFVATQLVGDNPPPDAATASASPEATTTTEATPTPAAYTPTFTNTRCQFDVPADRDVRCGWLEVPEDRADPEGQTIRLHVAIFKSTAFNPPDDPVVYLDGGPGASTLGALTFQFALLWEPFLQNRDLIMFDQRGIGYSIPELDCPEVTESARRLLASNPSDDEARADQLAAYAACHDRLVDRGIDLSQFNSDENAADVADLRVALGIDEWNLLGLSYGTRLAQTVMRDHPEGIRSVILDSTYPLGVNLVEEAPRNLARSLDELWAGCTEDPGCQARFPDLEQRFYALVDQLNASPLDVSFVDFLGGGTNDTVLNGDAVVGMTFQALYSPQLIRILPEMIEQLEQRDTTAAAALLSAATLNTELVSVGMQFSVQCSGDLAFASRDAATEARTQYPDLARFFLSANIVSDFAFDVCDTWQVDPLPTSTLEPRISDITTLVLAGQYDPITPPRFGRLAAETLPNATFLQFPGLAHGTSVFGECPRSIVFAFLDAPEAPLDTACIDAMPAIAFAIPGAPVDLPPLVSFTETFQTIEVEGVAPEGWISPLPGTFARGESPIDQDSIVYQATPSVPPSLLVAAFEQQLGLDLGDPIAQRATATGSWQLWTAAGAGFHVDLALGDLDGATGVILLSTNEGDRDQLFDQLLLPAIDAFRVIN